MRRSFVSPRLFAAVLAAVHLAAHGEAAPDDVQRGMQLYRLRDCAGAVELLEPASRRAAHPGALIALGYCYRQMKRFPEAIDAYQRYLAAHFDDEKRVTALLEQTILEEKQWRESRPPPPAPAAPAAASSPAPVPSAAAAPPSPSAVVIAPSPSEPVARPRLWTWVAGGAAVAALGTGVVLGAMSRSSASEIQRAEHTGAEVAHLRDQVKWQAQKGNLFLGIGAGLTALSAALFVWRF